MRGDQSIVQNSKSEEKLLKRNTFWLLAIVIVTAALAGICVAQEVEKQQGHSHDGSEDHSHSLGGEADAQQEVPTELLPIIERVEKSVVKIKIYFDGEYVGHGAGWYVTEDRIVDNYHLSQAVLEVPIGVEVVFKAQLKGDDEEYPITDMLSYDPHNDAMVLVATQKAEPLTEVTIKLELLPNAGSFIPRGALNVILEMSDEKLQRGVTAISAGNHAIAVSYAAQVLGTNAKVVMLSYGPKNRIGKCIQMGTEIILVDDAADGFELVKKIKKDEGRKFVHPFDGPRTVLGTGTGSLESYRQAQYLGVAILPVDGGGLAAGMSVAIKLCNPECEIFGVEPHGARSMPLSFASGQPRKIDAVETVAKSLGAPFALPYSSGFCKKHIEEIVLISDDELFKSMAIMFHEMKLVTEPAAAATMAALIGPLRERVTGKRVGIIACGSNIDRATFADYIERLLSDEKQTEVAQAT